MPKRYPLLHFFSALHHTRKTLTLSHFLLPKPSPNPSIAPKGVSRSTVATPFSGTRAPPAATSGSWRRRSTRNRKAVFGFLMPCAAAEFGRSGTSWRRRPISSWRMMQMRITGGRFWRICRRGWGGSGEERRWVVTHTDANRVMTECYLRRDFYDLIDVDSFGSESSFLRSAYNALKLDGLFYVTSTDGYTSGGHRPHHSLASYGAFVRPMPYSNEVGLRMLIGGALREASVLGYRITPLFSYYSYHGPVFRVMLRMNRGKLPENRNYGFISYCTKCGNSQAFSWNELGRISCPCSDAKVSSSLVVSGPLWIGPLHNASYLTEMLNLAEQWGWTGNDTETHLGKLLKQMIDESDPKLPFGYIKLDEVASRAKINSPPLRTMMSALNKEGYAVSRSHIASNAIKTNCPMAVCIRIAKELQQC